MEPQLSQEYIEEVEARLHKLETEVDVRLKSILERYVPISEERVSKLTTAYRDTLDGYTEMITDLREEKRRQNDKITTLATEVKQYKEQIIVLSAQIQGGMPVPRG